MRACAGFSDAVVAGSVTWCVSTGRRRDIGSTSTSWSSGWAVPAQDSPMRCSRPLPTLPPHPELFGLCFLFFFSLNLELPSIKGQWGQLSRCTDGFELCVHENRWDSDTVRSRVSPSHRKPPLKNRKTLSGFDKVCVGADALSPYR